MTEELDAQLTDLHARMGKPLPKGSSVATREMVIEGLKQVQDPELMLNVWEEGNVSIEMTLTAPTCPIAGEMPGMVAYAVSQVEGVGIVDVRLVWDPPWTLDRISDELKMALGI